MQPQALNKGQDDKKGGNKKKYAAIAIIVLLLVGVLLFIYPSLFNLPSGIPSFASTTTATTNQVTNPQHSVEVLGANFEGGNLTVEVKNTGKVKTQSLTLESVCDPNNQQCSMPLAFNYLAQVTFALPPNDVANTTFTPVVLDSPFFPFFPFGGNLSYFSYTGNMGNSVLPLDGQTVSYMIIVTYSDSSTTTVYIHPTYHHSTDITSVSSATLTVENNLTAYARATFDLSSNTSVSATLQKGMMEGGSDLMNVYYAGDPLGHMIVSRSGSNVIMVTLTLKFSTVSSPITIGQYYLVDVSLGDLGNNFQTPYFGDTVGIWVQAT